MSKPMDPVERAKYVAPQDEATTIANQQRASRAARTATVPVAPVATAPPPAKAAAPKAPAMPAMPRYRVLETKRISWFGNMTTLPAGEVVDEAGYGAIGVARLREQGVKLELIDG